MGNHNCCSRFRTFWTFGFFGGLILSPLGREVAIPPARLDPSIEDYPQARKRLPPGQTVDPAPPLDPHTQSGYSVGGLPTCS